MPQAPQWVALVRVSVSQPFLASSSQFAKGAVQLPRPQTALRHTGVAFVTAHRTSHAPQFAMLVWVSAQAPAQQVCPEGHGRATEQPGTQPFPTQRLPAAQWSPVTQATHAWVVGSQRGVAPAQPMSPRHPLAQRFIPATQY